MKIPPPPPNESGTAEIVFADGAHALYNCNTWNTPSIPLYENCFD